MAGARQTGWVEAAWRRGASILREQATPTQLGILPVRAQRRCCHLQRRDSPGYVGVRVAEAPESRKGQASHPIRSSGQRRAPPPDAGRFGDASVPATPTLDLASIKGNTTRTSALNQDQARTITRWRGACGNPTSGSILRSVLKSSGAIGDDAMSTRALAAAMSNRASKAGVELRGLHAFRRWRITSELQAGESLPAVARRVGHVNVQTTAGYDVSTEADDAQGARRIGRGLFRSAGFA